MKGKFPNGLRTAMERVGLKPAALARLSGTSPQNIQRWRDGQRRLTPEWADRLVAHIPGSAAGDLVLGTEASGSYPTKVIRGDWVSADQLAEMPTALDADAGLRPANSNMTKALKEVVANRLVELGINPFEAARKGDLERSYINDILIERKLSVRENKIAQLARSMDWTVGELLASLGRDITVVLTNATRGTVPVVGHVGAGAEYYAFDPGGELDRVPAPEGANDNTVAAVVRGESLGALFDQWLVFYDEVHDPPTRELIGRLCVVGLADGRVLVKKLMKGQLEDRFNLISNVEAPIYDQIVTWAAVVKQMTPR